MAKVNATLVMRHALDAWGGYSTVLSNLSDVWVLTTPKRFDKVHQHVGFAIQEFCLQERGDILSEHFKKFGGHSRVPKDEVDRLNPPEEVMRKLNMACGFHKIDRAFIHLYLHAHLYRAMGQQGPIDELDKILEKL